MVLDKCKIDGGKLCPNVLCVCQKPLVGKMSVRIVGTNVIFPSLSACARHFRVSERTISALLKGETALGEVKIERYLG